MLAVVLIVGAGGRRRPRRTIAGFLGFGLAGMSASFAGWATVFALVAAVAGAGALVAAATQLAPEVPTGGGE